MASLSSALTTQSNSNNRVCIVGAGPAGLYLAHLLLQQDETVEIDILEKAPLEGTPDSNAFGFGVGTRHQKFLEEIPGLWPRIEEHSAPVTNGPRVRIIGRNDLCRELLAKLEEVDKSKRCTVVFNEGCQSIDLDQHRLTTTNGKEIQYDLLVGCDGVNSMVRAVLVGQKGLAEEHYLRDAFWKSLKLPKQTFDNTIEPGAFQPLNHPSMKGTIIPRYPEGHSALVFWRDVERQNPEGVETTADLAEAFTQAVQPKSSKWDIAKKLLFQRPASGASSSAIQLQFDEKDLTRFVDSSAKREHWLKLDRYHDVDSRVALVGDAASGMYSILGQGAACSFLTANLLAKSIKKHSNNIPRALTEYSAQAVPEGHAISDLNLVAHAIFGGLMAKLLSIPLLLLNTLRGKFLMKRLNEDVTYQQIYKENSLLMRVSQYFWKKARIPFSKKSKVE